VRTASVVGLSGDDITETPADGGTVTPVDDDTTAGDEIGRRIVCSVLLEDSTNRVGGVHRRNVARKRLDDHEFTSCVE
jgi:hypothetical protein